MVFLIFTAAFAFIWVLFVGLSFLRRRQHVGGGVVMRTKVIYRDGTLGDVDSSIIDELRNEGKIAAYQEGKIAAYQVFLRWVEVRRMQSNPDYQGPERRRHDLTQANSL